MNDLSYLELDLPDLINEPLKALKKGMSDYKQGIPYNEYDLDWSELYSSINIAETGNVISKECADYLRITYLFATEDEE